MEKNPLIPIAVERYKLLLRNNPTAPLSFASFCRSEGLREESVRQWMRRHGLDLGALRMEAMLSLEPAQAAQLLEACARQTRTTHKLPKTSSSSGHIPAHKQLRGVNITFPDGVVVNIRQTTASSLTDFIDSYNKLIDCSNARLK